VTRLELDRVKEEISCSAGHGTKVRAFCNANVDTLPGTATIWPHGPGIGRTSSAQGLQHRAHVRCTDPHRVVVEALGVDLPSQLIPLRGGEGVFAQ
jgi:hypothetical protein